MRELIETPRLKLRPLLMRDAPAVARYCNDPGVGRMLAMTPLPYLPAAAEGWILTLAARASRGEDHVRAVDAPGEGLVGVIGAHKRGDGGFEVGCWFGRPFWGKGFATETLNGFTHEARALGALQSGHFVDNPASGRVLEKGGFAYTGEVASMFSMARGERVPCKRMAYAENVRAAA